MTPPGGLAGWIFAVGAPCIILTFDIYGWEKTSLDWFFVFFIIYLLVFKNINKTKTGLSWTLPRPIPWPSLNQS